MTTKKPTRTKKADEAKPARMAWNPHPFYPGSVACPACGAGVGEGCTNGRKTSHDAHAERLALHRATYDEHGQPIAQAAKPAEPAHQEEERAPFTSPLLVACPTCRSAAGVPCRNYKGQRTQTHRDRKDAASRAEADRAQAIAAKCAQVSEAFRLESPPEQMALGLASGPCYRPSRPAPQATTPAPLFQVKP